MKISQIEGGIMVSKGQIHMEVRYFREIFWNLIKSDDELGIEIRENGRFRKMSKTNPRNQKSLDLD